MKLSERMGMELGLDAKYIENISNRNNLYAKYKIRKKGGGVREILHPSKELKVLQYWLVRNVFNEFCISEFSSAYQKGCSVKKNADVHRKNRYILHTDITKFFPSITRHMLLSFFKSNGEVVRKLSLSKEDVDLILDICLYRGQYLVIGSVASPIIANIFMYDFDRELFNMLSEKDRFQYTRYADDIVISSNHYIDKLIIDDIEEIMVKYGFSMNREKTYFMCKKMKRQITGVVIDNNTNSLSIGHRKYDNFKRDLYKYFVRKEGDINYIKGQLAYIKGISATQYNQLREIYLRYDKEHEIFNNKD